MPSNISEKEFSSFIESIEKMLEKEKKHNKMLSESKSKRASEFKEISDSMIVHFETRLDEYRKYFKKNYSTSNLLTY